MLQKGYVPQSKGELVYKTPVTFRDYLPSILSIGIYLFTFILWMYLDGAYYGFGHKIITPLTSSMWIIGAVFSALMPSQRKEIVSHTKWFILGYMGLLFVYKFIIMAVSNVSSENMSAAFNVGMPAAAGTAISGWLQNLLWIIAIMYPIAYFIFQAKKIPQFFGSRSKERAMREIRDIRNTQKPY